MESGSVGSNIQNTGKVRLGRTCFLRGCGALSGVRARYSVWWRRIDKVIICKFALVAGTFKKIRRRIWLILNIGVVFWVLAGAFSMQVPPHEFWPAGFLAFSLPAALVLNFLFLLYWLLRGSWYLVLPLAVVVLGWNYYGRLLNMQLVTQEVPTEAKTLHVLSFNVHMFRAYKDDKDRDASEEMIEWIATHPADVYCLQEFYNDRESTVYNAISKIGTRYDKYRYTSGVPRNRNQGEFGVAIFSRYPIVNQGEILFGQASANRVAWVDVDVKGDTVRVYASHLQSMSIKQEDIENTYTAFGNQAEMEREGRNLARRLRKGFIARGQQVEVLREHYTSSPYPVIVAGDFNDIPFSYTYQVLTGELINSFEVAGFGIGATYNGPLPFLRIDNQFYSDGLRVYGFETHHEMGLSDHYPISARYVLEPKAED